MDNEAYREEHIKYRKLLGMGCDIMLTEAQAGEVAKLLGTGHVAMHQNELLRQDTRHWQDKHIEALNKCAQLTRALELANELNRELQKENEDYRKRMGVQEQGTGQEEAGQRTG